MKGLGFGIWGSGFRVFGCSICSATIIILVTHCEESLDSIKGNRADLQDAVDKKVGIPC